MGEECSVPSVDSKRYKGPKRGVRTVHFFLQKKVRNSLIFFSNIRVETIQIFQRPEKSVVEMMEHMSGMRLFSFSTDFHRNLMLL